MNRRQALILWKLSWKAARDRKKREQARRDVEVKGGPAKVITF